MRARAFGAFFRQGSTVYYGEYPLSFAACTGQRDIVSYLKRHGAHVNNDRDTWWVLGRAAVGQWWGGWCCSGSRWGGYQPDVRRDSAAAGLEQAAISVAAQVMMLRRESGLDTRMVEGGVAIGVDTQSLQCLRVDDA